VDDDLTVTFTDDEEGTLNATAPLSPNLRRSRARTWWRPNEYGHRLLGVTNMFLTGDGNDVVNRRYFFVAMNRLMAKRAMISSTVAL